MKKNINKKNIDILPEIIDKEMRYDEKYIYEERKLKLMGLANKRIAAAKKRLMKSDKKKIYIGVRNKEKMAGKKYAKGI